MVFPLVFPGDIGMGMLVSVVAADVTFVVVELATLSVVAHTMLVLATGRTRRVRRMCVFCRGGYPSLT